MHRIRPPPPLPAYPPSAADKRHSVNFDVRALIAGALYIGIMLPDMAFGHTPVLLQLGCDIRGRGAAFLPLFGEDFSVV